MHLIALGVASVRDYITMAPCLIVPCRVGSLVRSAVFRTPSLTKPKDSVNLHVSNLPLPEALFKLRGTLQSILRNIFQFRQDEAKQSIV